MLILLVYVCILPTCKIWYTNFKVAKVIRNILCYLAYQYFKFLIGHQWLKCYITCSRLGMIWVSEIVLMTKRYCIVLYWIIGQWMPGLKSFSFLPLESSSRQGMSTKPSCCCLSGIRPTSINKWFQEVSESVPMENVILEHLSTPMLCFSKACQQ